MTDSQTTPEFQRGWDAAFLAARQLHEARASETITQARPKSLEREAEVHRRSAELIVTLSPDDVSLKSWVARLAARAGMRKAKVALARKLAVVLHRMLVYGARSAADKAAARPAG